MGLNDYTSSAEVRAVLGVSEEELEDDTIALDLYLFNLKSELRDVDVALMTKYDEIRAIESGRTDPQQYFYETMRLFCTYAVAKQLTSSLPMFGPKDISDSKATVTRFSDSPYKETIKKVCAQFDLYRTRLQAAYNAVGSAALSTPDRTYFAVSSPNTDRVVG